MKHFEQKIVKKSKFCTTWSCNSVVSTPNREAHWVGNPQIHEQTWHCQKCIHTPCKLCQNAPNADLCVHRSFACPAKFGLPRKFSAPCFFTFGCADSKSSRPGTMPFWWCFAPSAKIAVAWDNWRDPKKWFKTPKMGILKGKCSSFLGPFNAKTWGDFRPSTENPKKWYLHAWAFSALFSLL